MNKEPAVIISAIVSLATALLGVAVAFGVDLSSNQQTALLGVAAAVAPLVAGALIRARVFAPASVDSLVREAVVVATGVYEDELGELDETDLPRGRRVLAEEGKLDANGV